MRAGTPSAVEKGKTKVNAKSKTKGAGSGVQNDAAQAVGEHSAEENGAAGGYELAYFLTFKLDLIKSEMISRANAAYRPAFGLDVRSLRVLRIICDAAGITATELKEQTLIEKTLLSKLVADLIERKLVRRSIHPDDARHFQLWPTAAGKRVRAASDELGQSLETEMLSMLSAGERGELNRIVDKLVEVFRKTGRGRGGR
ncbi:MarR family winged helix-turn-helix transcriptional regulator [Paraburkholderia sp. ZP32-5]|uniref:MarR family winged helix-turn-helix transcriptional regulator n=1 Tax=Paraburkholderia sp. ZP32-5 TaxID=2883245 RepID=UPI001F411D07|nr:MarR family winged helix-turn-helix transcriptional regulator [Paraburkholderia sp. ZP32-5]